MKRLKEIIRCFMLREWPVKKFEKEITKGEAFTVEVLLRKGMEYTVRGDIAKGSGEARISLGDIAGYASPVDAHDNRAYFSVTPEEDGVYTIWSTVKPTAGSTKPVTFTITLYRTLPVPTYLTQEVKTTSHLPGPEPELRPGTRIGLTDMAAGGAGPDMGAALKLSHGG